MKKISLLSILLYCSPLFAGELTLSAAASLRNAFSDVISQYAQVAPDTKIHLNTAGSGTLLQQIRQGAPVDIFASADMHTMQEAQKEKLLANQTFHVFAMNELVLATPINKPIKINQLSDIKQNAIKRIALSNPDSVPAGRYGKMALDNKGLWKDLNEKIIRTRDVRQSLDYIARGEVDIGFVYRTDAALMPKKVQIVHTVKLPEKVLYPIALTSHSHAPDEAQRLIDFIRSPKGQKILNQYGFRQPE